MLRMQENTAISYSFLLRLASSAVFAGRAWQMLYWDIPIRSWLWDEELMRPLISGWPLHIAWSDWVSSAAVDNAIATAVQCMGCFLAVAAVVSWLPLAGRKIRQLLLAAGGLILIFLALLYTKEKFMHLGQFFEYSLQFGTVFLLLWTLQKGYISGAIHYTARVAIALTFACHGLYAAGYYPVPGSFMSMVMTGLGIGQADALQLLYFAGIADFAAAGLLLLPWRAAWLPGLLYTVIWGLLTTLARLWSNYWISDWETMLVYWLHEFIYRLPHFLIPLWLLLLYRTELMELRTPETVA